MHSKGHEEVNVTVYTMCISRGQMTIRICGSNSINAGGNHHFYDKKYCTLGERFTALGPILLTQKNFNHSMDKLPHTQ